MGKLKQWVSGAVATVAMAPVVVLAAVPTEVTTALGDAKTDAVSVAGTVIGIIVAIAAFLYMRKAIR